MELLQQLKLTTAEDSRANFGTEEEPEVDSDLENETNRREFQRSIVQERVKDGVETLDDSPFLLDSVGEGDQFMATKPWEGVVRNSVPTGYRPSKGEDDPPDATLELEYVHGYRCHDTRNNLRYTHKGTIVYHTAAVGITLDQATNTQAHFLCHTDDIISFDISAKGDLAVTGEIGRTPLLCVWNTQTMQSVKSFKGLLKKGIVAVACSPDGSRVAGMGADEEHAVVVYDVGAGGGKPGVMQGVLATGKGGRDSFLQMKFHPASVNKMVACGLKVFAVLEIANGALTVRKGTGWGKTANTQHQALTSIGFLGSTTVTGAFNGCIFKWNETSLSQAVKVHEGAVVCIGARTDYEGLVTGGNDGFVHILDLSLNKVKSIDLKTLGSAMPRPRSCCAGPSDRLLIGTRGGEIYEIVGQNAKAVLKGHFDKELWGLAAHPTRGEYATTGQDGLLCIWDVSTKKQKSFTKLGGPSTVVAYSPDGSFLAAGLENGKFLVLDSNSLNIVATKHDRTKAVSELKFSPNGRVLAVGAHDSVIMTYSASEDFSLRHKLRGHHSTVTHLDFSAGGEFIQSTSTSYDILFHDLNSGRTNPSGASAYRDERWNSWTTTLGWPVQGIWPPCTSGDDINAVDRARSGQVLATADDFGQVKLFKFPCAKKGAGFTVFKGHSSHVTNCRFVTEYLISTGGHDKAVFQWKFTEEHQDPVAVSEALEAAKEETGAFQLENVGAGDQFLAVKPWLGELQASAPVNYTPARGQSRPPEQGVSLLKVHGYRSFDSRNNLRFTATGEVVYPAAALGVVMERGSRTQRFFGLHDDDVVSLAIHPNRRVVATGQMVHVGKSRTLELHVWDAETLESLVCLKGFHRRAIRHLAFSPGGEKLLSVGEDDDHSLAVYTWESSILLCSSKVDKDAVLGASFITEDQLSVHGAKFIKFFTINGKNCTVNRGTMGLNKPFEAQICGIAFNGTFTTGTHAGNLIMWAGRTASRTIKAHQGQVWSLCVTESSLLSGGSDGVIIEWDAAMRQLQTVNIQEFSLSAGIRSIDVSPEGTLLVGTRGAEILEIKNWHDVDTLGTGHFAGELWGLAVHPSHALCATCGGDKTIRIWDLSQGTMVVAIKPLPHDMRAIDWSPDGNALVSGLVNGMVLLLDAGTLSTLSSLQSTFKNADCWIEDIKYSPDGTRVAFGTHGGASKVEIMRVQNNKLAKMYSINAGLTSALTHLDWSVDGALLVVNSQAYELKFVSVEGKRNVASSSVRNVEWSSWSCVLGWPVQYIWPEFADGTDINSCARSNSSTVLATADDFGKVSLFRWPVCVKGQTPKSYTGHSSHVTSVKFTCDDAFLVSTGGNDKCVFVWQSDLAEAEHEPVGDERSVELDDIPKESSAAKRHEESREKTKAKLGAALDNNDANSFFQFEEIGEGDQFMASKPWVGAIKPPSNFIKAPRGQNKPPAVRITLDFVHGYRSKDCRNNLKYLPDGRIIYHAAGLGIIYDKRSHTQSFFDKHVDDIIAFDVTLSGELAATGEVGRRPNIFIWDTRSLMTVCNFKAPLEKGIASVAFTPSGDKIAAVAMDDDHHIAVYNVSSSALLFVVKGDREKIVNVGFVTETEFVTTGVKHFKLWNIVNNTAKGQRGAFGRNNNILLCLTIQNNTVYTGTAAGTVIRWQGTAPSKSFPLHSKAVDSLWSCSSCIVSGGKDGIINILDNNMNKRQSFDMNNTDFGSVSALVRSAQLNEEGSSLLVGTYGSEIYELQVSSGVGRCFMRGHYTPSRGTTVTNEVWGLAVFPDNLHYVSVSDDGTLRVWNKEKKEQVQLVKFCEGEEVKDSAKARAVDVAPDGSILAVGFKDGSFKTIETNTWAERLTKKDRREELSAIKFSPDGSKLAVGSHDNFVDIYSVPEFKQLAVCRGHSSYITHLDWAADSANLQTNCGAYELLFWEGGSGRQLTAGATALRNEQWASWTCVIGWPVQGIYPAYADGTDVNAVDRSRRKFGNAEYPIVATADDYGLVKLFRYPCLTKGAEALIGRGHSSHVTNVKFSPDDQYLYSAGGDDQCIFQWRISDN